MLVSPFSPRGGTMIVAGGLLVVSLFLYLSRLSSFHKEPVEPAVPSPIYRPDPIPNPPVTENFPLAAVANSSTDLPPVPSFNRPRNALSSEPAPLFIGFTRNWPILQQAVVSYLAAGWPASSVYVIENTGTMNANAKGQLTLQNPFYIDYHRLTEVYGVNVVTTPTLLTFAQLQNFMMNIALEHEWHTYFWSHMDVCALADEKFTTPDREDQSTGRYLSLFERAVRKRDDLQLWATRGDGDTEGEKGKEEGAEKQRRKWACNYFAYDRLTLVNLEAYMDIGGWDPMISYYTGDCDFYERLRMGGYRMDSNEVGLIADVGSTLDDLGVLFRRQGWDGGEVGADFGTEDERGGEGYDRLREQILELEHHKLGNGDHGRNFWQSQQQGGQGEPFYRDSEGFERALLMMIEDGRQIYAEKWGHHGCDLRAQNLQPGDAWRVEHGKDF